MRNGKDQQEGGHGNDCCEDDPNEVGQLGDDQVTVLLQNGELLCVEVGSGELCEGRIFGNHLVFAHGKAAGNVQSVALVGLAVVCAVQGVGVADVDGRAAFGGNGGLAGKEQLAALTVLDGVGGLCVDRSAAYDQRAAGQGDAGAALGNDRARAFGRGIGYGHKTDGQRHGRGNGDLLAVQVKGIVAVQSKGADLGVGKQLDGAVLVNDSGADSILQGQRRINDLANRNLGRGRSSTHADAKHSDHAGDETKCQEAREKPFFHR